MTTVAVVGVLALALAGCGSQADLDASRAQALQADVLAVTQAAAAGKWAAADTDLASTRAHLDAALDAGDVSVARYREIEAALARVTAVVAAERERASAAAKKAAPVATPSSTKPAPTPTPTTRRASSTPAAPAATGPGKSHAKGPGTKHPPKPGKSKKK